MIGSADRCSRTRDLIGSVASPALIPRRACRVRCRLPCSARKGATLEPTLRDHRAAACGHFGSRPGRCAHRRRRPRPRATARRLDRPHRRRNRKALRPVPPSCWGARSRSWPDTARRTPSGRGGSGVSLSASTNRPLLVRRSTSPLRRAANRPENLISLTHRGHQARGRHCPVSAARAPPFRC